MEKSFEIWIGENDDFYIIPSDHVFAKGMNRISNLLGEEKYVDLESITQYAKNENTVHGELKKEWQTILDQGKKIWQQLHAFAQITKKEKLEIDFQTSFMEALVKSGIKLEQEDLPNLENPSELFSEQEQIEMATKATGMIKNILGDIVEDVPDNPDDLEAWSESLHDKFFSKEIVEEENQTKEDIQKSIKESIAKHLKEQGLDFIK